MKFFSMQQMNQIWFMEPSIVSGISLCKICNRFFTRPMDLSMWIITLTIFWVLKTSARGMLVWSPLKGGMFKIRFSLTSSSYISNPLPAVTHFPGGTMSNKWKISVWKTSSLSHIDPMNSWESNMKKPLWAIPTRPFKVVCDLYVE